MGWRRVANLGVVVVIAAASGGTYGAAAALSTPHVSNGAVDLTVSPDADGQSSDFTVHFTGPVSDHGWSHSGTLTAVGATWLWTASLADTPILSVTSDDGTVTGTCVGASQAAGADETAGVTPATALDMTFVCVLSHSGGTPWQISLRTALTQGTGAATTWSGSYVEGDAPTPVPNVNAAASYGEVQLGDLSSSGSFQYGPLRLSGQIDIGGVLYRGDLVSGRSAPVAGNDIPPLAVSGSSNGVGVAGSCSGVSDQVLGLAATAYTFSCSLAVGSAAPVTVSLKSVFDSAAAGCSYRDCWSDSAGNFTSG